MPKRQRVPRYSIVAAEDNNPENSGVRVTNNGEGADTHGTGSRAGPSPSARPPSNSSTSPSRSSPRRRKKNRGQQQQYHTGLSPSSTRQKQSPKRQQHQRQLAAEEILLQLLKACEKHRDTCHPDYNPRSGSQDSEIPHACESAIKSLRLLIPKLECTICPSNEWGSKKISSNDIAQLCRFYDNVVRGTYCPHLPHLFGFGTDPQIVLDKVVYLLRNSLNVDLNWNNANVNEEEYNRNKTSNNEFFDVVSRTISGLLSSVIDDASDHIRRKLFVDWIDFAEDIAILSTMNNPNHFESESAKILPVQVILFEESSFVVQERHLQGVENDQDQNLDNDDVCNSFSLEIHGWEQIKILQEICLRVLSFLTSKECVLERLEISPEQQGEEPWSLLGGDMDTYFPPGIAMEMSAVSSILASIKPVLLKPYTDDGLFDRGNYSLSKVAVELLVRLCVDWHRLGSATVAIPMLPCIIDAAILTTRTALQSILENQQPGRKDGDESVESDKGKYLTFLLYRMVCFPPGYDPSNSHNKDSIVTTIHSAVWTVLLDCLKGISSRLSVRRKRNIKKYKEGQAPPVTASTPSISASSIMLDLAVLNTIHFIAATTQSLAIDGVNYCTARGIFPHLFFLSSTTSLATCDDQHNWNDDSSLMRVAGQCLALFVHAASARDTNDRCKLDNIFNSVIRDDVARHFETAGVTEATSQSLETTITDGKQRGKMDHNQYDMRDGEPSLKRKRQPPISGASDINSSVKQQKLLSGEFRSAAVYPISWCGGIECFLRLVMGLGGNLKKAFDFESSKFEEGDRIAVASVIEQIRCLLAGFRLSLSLLRKLSRSARNENENEPLSGISLVVQEMSTRFVAYCEFFSQTIHTNEKLERATSVAMVEAILECGLSMHFSQPECQSMRDTSLDGCVRKFLDSISSFSGKLLELIPPRRFDFGFLSKDAGTPMYLLGVGNQHVFEPPQCCWPSLTQVENDRKLSEWGFDQSIRTLHSFPLFVQAAMMTSLQPVERNLFSAESETKPSSLFGHYSLDLFVTYLNRHARADLVELDWSKRVASLLQLLPIMMVSLSSERGSWLVMKALRESDNNDGERNEESWISSLQILFRKVLNPLVRAFKSEDTFVFRGLVFALSHMHKLITEKPIKVDTTSPMRVLELLTVRHTRINPTKIKKNELRGMMIDVANKGIRNDENSLSRYLLWVCGSQYCINASPSEVLHCSRNTTTGPNGENTADSSGLLRWLVAAPFSDPNALLRKFLSREISTLLMSTEYSYLLSRFASSEDYKKYYAYSRVDRVARSEGAMHSLLQMSDHVVNGLFEEIDGLRELSERSKRDDQLTVQQSAVRTLASLCYNADLNHPLGKALFEKGALRLIRMWTSESVSSGDNLSFPDLHSTPAGRALAFGRLVCLSRSNHLGQCLSGEKMWTHFPSASFSDVLILNKGKNRREQYELLERMVRSFFLISHDSLNQKQSARETSKVVSQSIPSAIAQLVHEKDEETIRLIIGFNVYLTQRLDICDKESDAEVHLIGVSNLSTETKKYPALSMGSRQLQKETKKACLRQIDKMLPLVLLHSDEEPVPLEFFTKLTAPVTLADMVAGREQPILKGIAWELGRDPYRVGPALFALKTAANACGRSGSAKSTVSEGSTDTNRARMWVTKNFMYLIVNMVQLNWRSRETAHKGQALRCLLVLLDFLDPSDAPQYLPQVLSTVNAAIAPKIVSGAYDSDENSLRLHAIRCLSKFIRLSATDNIEPVIDNLTTIVVSLLPILGDGDGEDKCFYQETQVEAASVMEFLAQAKFVRKFPKAFSRIPFLPMTPLLAKVHASLRDNGISFDNLMILSTTTTESQAGTLSRRESLTSENVSNSASSGSSSSGDYVLALQNRMTLVASLLCDENASVRKVALQHLVDLLRANRNSFHILVENEGGSSVRSYLTLVYDQVQNGTNKSNMGYSNKATSVSVSNVIEILMERCVYETDQQVRLQLATCLGEIGAIGEHKLDDISVFRSRGKGSRSMYEWRLEQPPWQSRAAKYELQLVTKYLVAALKSAPSQEEQLKIAYTIQQMLLLLDASVREGGSEEANQQSDSQKREMSKWLLDRLVEAEVYESVEPFWLSEFSTKDERYSKRQPPFFPGSKSYHLWISEFCRWMIWKTKDCPLSRWKDFFFACRILVRSRSGLEAAEFILPLLVLDRICFGSVEEFESICKEFRLVLDFNSDSALMDSSERQKAVGGFFSMIDTLEYWAEIEAEQRYRSKTKSTLRRSVKSNARQNRSNNDNCSSNWPADDTITQIEELISRIPLIDQAKAATNAGMHAKGLRLLELLTRKTVVQDFFESSGDEDSGETVTSGNLFQQSLLKNANIDLMKTVLSNLNDCETLNMIGEASYLLNPLLDVKESIQWKEASGDYEGALRDYERAIQARRIDHPVVGPGFQKGALACLLKLGRFEDALSRAMTEAQATDNISYAVEAASNLGQWDKLSVLVTENEAHEINFSPDDAYRQATGKAILGLRSHDWEEVGESLRAARNAIMDNLSRVARESYSRSYADIAKLQSIRELEDAASLFHSRCCGDEYLLGEVVESTLQKGWAWKGRLELTTPRAAAMIMHTRVVIARLDDDPMLESSFLLDIGKQASTNGMRTVAEDFYSQAEAAISIIPTGRDDKNQKLGSLLDDIRMQYANLKKESGENLVALKIIGQEMVQNALLEMNRNNNDMDFITKIAVKYEQARVERTLGRFVPAENDRKLIDRFASRLLRLTQWSVESGMQSGNEIMERFQTVIKLSPQWEIGHFQFAKYLNDSVARFFEKDTPHGMEEDQVRFHSLYRDRVCHKYILLAIGHYATTLKLDMKHVYHALPRLLSLWFDFVSVQTPTSEDNMPAGAFRPEYLNFLAENQNRANLLMADNTKAIPAAAYYTAMPQLISRVIHNNEDTGKVVKRILERVLTKFPPQAMWHLAWLKGSKNKERSRIGADIFKGAQRVLIKNRQTQVANLLKASDSLFKYLQDLARYTPKGKSHTSVVSVKPWKGMADLSEFIPPVQAALSISPFKPVKSSSKEYFPRVIPRMRAFSSKVSIMHSKARPKKIKAFAVPGTWKHANVNESSSGGGRTSSSTALDCDIGEIHFLVKQEAKGDLRKDARVQDLNNVINRLMASSNNSNSTLTSKSRRLRVRTFAVTCLSEDTGILEWVPDTDSLRNLVSKSYNPQVSSFCDRRRGQRMTNFNDSTLRSGFERAQNQFVKNGDLPQAVRLYYLLVLKQYPPVLSWWFIQQFRSATDWYEARQKFALTAAAWSAIGHVIGLGDRHSENILVETKTGRIVHVDFDCIFDKGLNLPRPEVVPFRLTPNMLDAFGPTGADGIFKSGMESSLDILRKNRDTLLSVLEPFIKDPVIDWKKQRTQQSVPLASKKDESQGEAKRSIKVIKERLSGICNLRNPNYRRLRGIIPQDVRQRVEQDNMMKDIIPLSVEGQVQKLCTEASKNENLVQVYVGWMPWI